MSTGPPESRPAGCGHACAEAGAPRGFELRAKTFPRLSTNSPPPPLSPAVFEATVCGTERKGAEREVRGRSCWRLLKVEKPQEEPVSALILRARGGRVHVGGPNRTVSIIARTELAATKIPPPAVNPVPPEMREDWMVALAF